MKDYFGYAPAVVVPRLIAALIVVIFTRLMAPEEFGHYALIFIYGQYADSIFMRWIRLGYTRFYFGPQGPVREVEAVALALSVPSLLAAVVFSLLVSWISADAGPWWGALLVLYVFANSAVFLGLQYLRVRERRGVYVWEETLRSVSGLAIAYGLVTAFGPHYEYLILGTQGAALVAGLVLVAAMLRAIGRVRLDRALVGSIVAYSAPLSVSFFLGGTLLIADRVLLEHFQGTAALGVYAASYQLARPAIEVLFNIVNTGGFPKLLRHYEQEGDAAASRVLTQKWVAMAFVTLPVLTALLVLAQPLSDLLLEGEYAAGAATVFRLVAVAAFFRGITTFVFDQVFQLHRKTTLSIYGLVSGLAVTVAAGMALIPSQGAAGAAAAGALGSAAGAVTSYVLARRRMPLRVVGREIYAILALCVAGGVLLGAGDAFFGMPGWIGAGLVCGVLYLAACRALGIFTMLRS